MNPYLAIQRITEQQRIIQACFSSPLPHGENWTMDNYALKFESSAHLNLDEINQRLNINYHQIDRKECIKFCIFLFAMLNTSSLSTAFPTCNTDLPLTPILYVELISGSGRKTQEAPWEKYSNW